MSDVAPRAAEAGRMLRSGAVTSEALTRQALDRIAERDGKIHAFVHVDKDGAIAAARQADAELARGDDRGPLHGLPYAIKDIYDAKGMPTTCGSRLRLEHKATEDSAVVERFREGGAVLLGKLATFEFALGGPCFDLPWEPTRNPWSLERIPGGSSSGSGAAIAAGYVAIAPGSCTTGSIRGPAAWCGAVGLKPTFGRVSRRGVFPLSGSLDHCGPLARSVHDAALALSVMAGHDPRDPSSSREPVADYCAGLDGGVSGLRIGVPRDLFETAPGMSGDMLAAIDQSLAMLTDLGAVVSNVALPESGQFLACGRVLMIAEAFATHRELLRTRLADYGSIAAKRFAVGAEISSADYLDAILLKELLTRAVDDALADQDVLITAISLDIAPKLVEEKSAGAWPMQASPFNVTGHPAISVPTGLDRIRMPLALQIVGRPFDEATILRAARSLEAANGWEQVALP
tara:strand:+ start:16506 stop:17885 length:1380 start_codon:yes stop_codon:yes gene_type:complete